MSFIQGALGGAMSGAALGPWGALAGGVLGGIMGNQTKKMPTAAEMGINPINAKELAQGFMPSQSELSTQRSQFQNSTNGQIESYAQQLIGSGMDPRQAYSLAQNKYQSAAGQFEANQMQSQNSLLNGLASQFMPMQMQREEDILNYNIARNQSQAGVLESFLPLAGSLWGSQSRDEIKDSWAGAGNTLNTAWNAAKKLF